MTAGISTVGFLYVGKQNFSLRPDTMKAKKWEMFFVFLSDVCHYNSWIINSPPSLFCQIQTQVPRLLLPTEPLL